MTDEMSVSISKCKQSQTCYSGLGNFRAVISVIIKPEEKGVSCFLFLILACKKSLSQVLPVAS